LNSSVVQNDLPTNLKRGHRKADVVILGAGFSKSFGVPLANELLKELVSRYAKSFPSIKYVDAFVKDFYPNLVAGHEYPDIEDFLAMTETAVAYSQIRNTTNRGYYWRPKIIADLMSTVNKCLGDYLWNYQKTVPIGLVVSVDKLLSHLRDNPVFVSFNYDLLLETALSELGRKFKYGLSYDQNDISILKPHGSINWFQTGTLSTLPIIHIGKNIEVPITLEKDQLRLKRWKESIIVIPSPIKKIDLFEMKKMWTSFTSVVSTLNSLTVIGYSLPHTDKLSRLVIRRAGPFQANCKNIVIVDPSSIVVDTFRKYVSSRSTGFTGKFVDWIAVI